MELRQPALEHGTTRGGRWFRVHRVRLALWIAVAEGALVVFDVLSGWAALAIAAVVVAFYALVGRNLRKPLRDLSWAAALSQILVALIPALVFVVGALALFALAVLAALALFALLADRR